MDSDSVKSFQRLSGRTCCSFLSPTFIFTVGYYQLSLPQPLPTSFSLQKSPPGDVWPVMWPVMWPVSGPSFLLLLVSDSAQYKTFLPCLFPFSHNSSPLIVWSKFCHLCCSTIIKRFLFFVPGATVTRIWKQLKKPAEEQVQQQLTEPWILRRRSQRLKRRRTHFNGTKNSLFQGLFRSVLRQNEAFWLKLTLLIKSFE